jgi:TRAP-type C4-dicarboxylate transport system permease small subunit
MRKPSLFVRLLIVITGGFLTLPFLLMRNFTAAAFSFLFFAVCWSLLQFVGRNQAGMNSKTKWHFRFILLVGFCGMTVALYLFVTSLLNGQYKYAASALSSFILIVGNAWRYRIDLIAWLKNNPVT